MYIFCFQSMPRRSDKYMEKAKYYKGISDHRQMIRCFMKAISFGDRRAMFRLGEYYFSIESYAKMKKYLLMAIKKKNIRAMNFMGKYYETIGDEVNMVKYYAMSIDNGDMISAFNMAYYYDEVCRDETKMLKYYTMCIENGVDNEAAFNLGVNYMDNDDFEMAAYYWDLGAQHGCKDCATELAFNYHERDNVDMAIKYYELAFGMGETYVSERLVDLYQKQNNHEKLLRYCLICVENADNEKSKRAKFVKIALDTKFDIILAHKYRDCISGTHLKRYTEALSLHLNLSNAEEEECVICASNSNLIHLNCHQSHKFCNQCIQMMDKCPICRAIY